MDIHTAYQPPLSPGTRGVWTAIDADTYDGAPDAGSVMGHGLTEDEAIADLQEQMAMRVGEAA